MASEQVTSEIGVSKSAYRGLILFTLTLFYLYFFTRILWRIGDEGTLVYGAQRVAEGAIPYRDFFEVMGPLSFYWLGSFFKLFGTKIIVARGLLMLTGAATATLIYWITRHIYSGKNEMFPAVFYTIISIPLWPVTNHHWDSNLFALLAFGSFLLWKDTGKRKYLISAGLLAGLTSCFIQQKGPYLFFAFLLAQLIDDHREGETKTKKMTNLGSISASYIGIGTLVSLFFYFVGGLDELIYANLLWPLSNYQNVNFVPYAYGLFEFHWQWWVSTLQTFFSNGIAQVLSTLLLTPVFLVAILPFLIFLIAVASYRRSEKRVKVFSSATIPYWLVGWALWISEAHRMDVMHLIYGSPLLLVMLFVLWENKNNSSKINPWRIGFGFIVSSLMCFGISQLFFVSIAGNELHTRRGNILSFKEDAALSFLMENTSPNEAVFIYPYYPMYYFLADVYNPTRYSIMMYGINTEEQFHETISSLDHMKVKYVLWDTAVEGENLKLWFPNYSHPNEANLHLENYLESHYTLLNTKNGFQIMIRNND